MDDYIKNLDKPIYLHFLQKDLRTDRNFFISDGNILKYIITASFLSKSFLYCNNAMFWENNFEFPLSVDLLLKLCKEKIVMTVTNFSSFDEFIEDRQFIFKGDPIFRTDYIRANENLWNNQNILLNDITTIILRSKLLEHQYKNPGNLSDIINKGLRKNDSRAVTYSLFKTFIKQKSVKEELNIKRLISSYYYERYKNIFEANTVEGIYGFEFIDELNDYLLCTNFQIIYPILIYSGIVKQSYEKTEDIFNTICFYREESLLFIEILVNIQSIISGLIAHFKIGLGKELPRKMLVPFFLESIKELNGKCRLKPIQLKSKPALIALENLALLKRHLINKKEFEVGFNIMNQALTKTRKNILLLCATFTELKFVYEVFENDNIPLMNSNISNISCLLNQTLSEQYNIYVAEVGKGAIGIAGSLQTINEILHQINASYVIMVGMLMGMKPDKQQLGDIIIANQIANYESLKINTDSNIPRGDKITAPPYLSNSFSITSLKWKTSNIHRGLVLSGEKLINDPAFRQDLLKIEPEAIGCEMEGAALTSACVRCGVEWALVKGICDFGDNKNDKFQKKACINSISFILDVLKNFYS